MQGKGFGLWEGDMTHECEKIRTTSLRGFYEGYLIYVICRKYDEKWAQKSVTDCS